MFKTRITELFGVEHPVVQGGLMWIARAELVSAVANAGGMGFITALTFPTPQELAAEIRKTRQMTDKPFGVNVTFLPTLKPVDYGAYIDACIDEGVTFMETAGRNPEPYMEKMKKAGMVVTHKCTSVRHSIKAEQIGCDAVSIDGFEAAGHPGEDDVTSLILVPLTRDAITVPLIASGGFGDGRGLAAALALGADGLNMGTRFVATREAPVHDNVKEALVRASERDTSLIMRSLRNTERVLTNPVAEKVLEIEARGDAKIEDIAPHVGGAQGRRLQEEGDMEAGVLAAGQIIGLIRDIPTVRELMDRIIAEARETVESRFGPLLRARGGAG
jgi:NAD(P)H-dependent flavin oxidoreductase YrpB (nitropropane dioxygenase family)